ncbi:MAG: hypothetical protein A2Y37_02245 [Spirochaetes bacterium GWB1_60_80]|nr:MAG: hypothetical protein A2Y37_02245 [Spirochaetes bacterium GWB1_60_80]
MKCGVAAALLCFIIIVFSASCTLLSTGYTVSGQIVAPGSATADLSGYTISLRGANIAAITTGADGSFSFPRVPSGNYRLEATKPGKVFAYSYTAPDGSRDHAELPVYGGDITDIVVQVVDVDKMTIGLIQGSGARSPLEGLRVENVRGVITKVTRQVQNGTYTVTNVDGSITPQWLGTDGFYMESFDTDIDGNPLTSDGIFVCTHNPEFNTPKLLDSVPVDLAVGQVVTVSGMVSEVIPVDRFGNSQGFLSVTTITMPTVFQMRNDNVIITRAAPDGVLLTYRETVAGYEGDEIRTLPWEDDSIFALSHTIEVMESVEGMTVKVENPITTGSTYYNVTPLLADGGLVGGQSNKDLTTYGGIVLKANDFNAEVLYCDYSPPTWKTFDPLPQTGDLLHNTGGAFELRGVVNYTFDGIYWISPLATQGWQFNPVVGRNDFTRTSSVDNYRPFRIGSTASAQFVADWGIVTKGNTVDTNLTVASFNIENYCLEEDTYNDKKYNAIADIILYNLRAPDIITVIEMGDDKTSTVVFANQDNSYAVPDGVVWAVNNYRAIIDAIRTKSNGDVINFGGALEYDFREIAPEENVDGGAPGVNIRVGFLFRTDRVSFLERGIRTNSYATTNGDPITWPVPGDTASNTRLLALARNNVAVCGITGPDGITRPRLSQSPGRINASPFAHSRKPLAAEFTFLPTGKTVFVIGNHFGSKSGDTPLYGSQQPPIFPSETSRAQQARAVYDIVNAILGLDPNAKVVVTGDLNDFQFSLTNRTLSGAVYGRSSQILFSPSEELFPANEQYSYMFRGNSQQIDHIYVSPSLFSHIDTSSSGSMAMFIPHIDSIFNHMNKIETSDHDPLVVHLNLGGY